MLFQQLPWWMFLKLEYIKGERKHWKMLWSQSTSGKRRHPLLQLMQARWTSANTTNRNIPLAGLLFSSRSSIIIIIILICFINCKSIFWNFLLKVCSMLSNKLPIIKFLLVVQLFSLEKSFKGPNYRTWLHYSFGQEDQFQVSFRDSLGMMLFIKFWEGIEVKISIMFNFQGDEWIDIHQSAPDRDQKENSTFWHQMSVVLVLCRASFLLAKWRSSS